MTSETGHLGENYFRIGVHSSPDEVNQIPASLVPLHLMEGYSFIGDVVENERRRITGNKGGTPSHPGQRNLAPSLPFEIFGLAGNDGTTVDGEAETANVGPILTHLMGASPSNGGSGTARTVAAARNDAANAVLGISEAADSPIGNAVMFPEGPNADNPRKIGRFVDGRTTGAASLLNLSHRFSAEPDDGETVFQSATWAGAQTKRVAHLFMTEEDVGPHAVHRTDAFGVMIETLTIPLGEDGAFVVATAAGQASRWNDPSAAGGFDVAALNTALDAARGDNVVTQLSPMWLADAGDPTSAIELCAYGGTVTIRREIKARKCYADPGARGGYSSKMLGMEIAVTCYMGNGDTEVDEALLRKIQSGALFDVLLQAGAGPEGTWLFRVPFGQSIGAVPSYDDDERTVSLTFKSTENASGAVGSVGVL